MRSIPTYPMAPTMTRRLGRAHNPLTMGVPAEQTVKIVFIGAAALGVGILVGMLLARR